jgi:general secretion pathway protein A
LSYGSAQRKGIIVITGEIGTGKTTLCRYFLDQLGNNTKTAFILNPYFSDIQLLEAIVKDFGINVKEKSRLSFIGQLNKFLIRESEAGNNVILIIDEAQNLKSQQLEQVRLLSNLETEKNKLIQIILAGQPELNHKLAAGDLRQLQQRVMVRYHITPLERNETKEYLSYRLSIAGAMDRVKFTDEASEAVFEFSGGTPRLINMLCDRALLAGFVAESQVIGLDIINRCTEELHTHSCAKAK